MKVIIEADQRGRERIRRGRFAAFFLGFLFIFSHISCLSASSESSNGRKARFFNTKSSSSSAPLPHHHHHRHQNRARRSGAANPNGIFDNAKRIVHTGPNPLHN